MGNYKRILILAMSLLVGMSVITSGAATSKKEILPEYGAEDTNRYEVATNRHTQYVPSTKAECVLTTAGFEEKINNGVLAVWYSQELDNIRIVDMRSGYIWGCMDDREEYNLNKKWTARATSLCDISYFDREGKEESAALSEGTFKASYDWKPNGFICQVSAKKLGISFEFEGVLNGEQFTFNMKDESIKETGKSKLSSVSFMSFFGAVYEDTVPGYVMVPDGSGALIRFRQAKAYQSGYSRKVYGNDLAIDRDTTLNNLNGNRTDDYATEENQLSLPLWGMVHGEGQNGFLATVDSGENYTMINAIPAGAVNETVKITRAYATFVYRNQYNKRVSNTKTVLIPQEELNVVNPKLTFTFLSDEDADYSGMARIYRQQLLSKGLLSNTDKPEEETDDISLLLHVIGSEVKKGFLSNGLATLTTAKQAETILEELEKENITNVSMILSGWNKGGYHGSSYGQLTAEKKVGSHKELKELQKAVETQGGRFALVLSPMTANEDQININQDAALNATLDTVKQTIPNQTLMYPTTYFLRHTRTVNALEKAFGKLEDFDLVLEGIGKHLYADYTINDEVSRDQAQKELCETVEKAKQDLILDAENLYLLQYASGLVDVPMSNSQYVYETDSVPFLQMVLRGSINYYAPYSNQGFYSNASILKMIEYGACPSFMVIGADNFSLNDTPLENYFSLSFKDWEEKIHEVYSMINSALAPVKGESIVSHTTEAEGVYCTTYSNGCKIWVNYNSESYTSSTGLSVPQGNYAMEE